MPLAKNVLFVCLNHVTPLFFPVDTCGCAKVLMFDMLVEREREGLLNAQRVKVPSQVKTFDYHQSYHSRSMIQVFLEILRRHMNREHWFDLSDA
uniref:Uncharacterized protein n=1 Tax=Noccaea caerulescens TaxID=107243 RepID=A0A1J3FYT6_NOCCA